MAMQSFDKEELQAPLAEINTTPLVDVMLVLMVIFLVTAPMITQSVKLDLPKETVSAASNTPTITISIDAKGGVFINMMPATEGILQKQIQDLAAKNLNQPIQLRADTKAVYGVVNHVLASLQRAGLTNIELLTLPN